MGNSSNPEQWAVQERLRFIERAAYWRGWVQRQDLSAVYGKGAAQVSADFQKYLELNPGALAYSTSRKRYEGQETMRQALQESRLEDAVHQYLSGTTRLPYGAVAQPSTNPSVEWVVLPQRLAPVEVERRIFQAVLHGQRVRVRYLSVHGSTAEWRWLRPRALAHDGHRWHVRAWCENHGDYRDFVLARMTEAEWPVAGEAPLLPDKDWEEWVTLRLRAHPSLTDEARTAVEHEYQMENGECRLRVRRAMLIYVQAHLRLPGEDGALAPPRLEYVAG